MVNTCTSKEKKDITIKQMNLTSISDQKNKIKTKKQDEESN